MKTKILTSLLMALTLAVSSHAELQGSKDYEPEKLDTSEWSALVGVSGGNSLIARDGTIFMNLRIGIALNPYISLGAYHSSIMSNVKNPKVRHSQMIDYHAYGVFAEPTIFRNGIFSISLPVSVGGGEIDFGASDNDQQRRGVDARQSVQHRCRCSRPCRARLPEYRFRHSIRRGHREDNRVVRQKTSPSVPEAGSS